MADELSDDLPSELDGALADFVAAGCPEEINAYLDRTHPGHPVVRHEAREAMPEREDFRVLPCSPGERFMRRWMPDKKGGHWFEWCAPE